MSGGGTILPSSPFSLCEDRFSLLHDSDDPLVPVWPLLMAVFASPAHTIEQLVEKLEIISICLRGTSGTDFSNLRSFLRHHWDTANFLTRVYPVLVQLALELPRLFPSGFLPALTPSLPSCILSRRQLACIIVHQFFCTLSPPSWLPPDGSPDFHIWFGSDSSNPRATHAYLISIFTYFDRITSESWILELSRSDWPITLELRSAQAVPSFNSPFTPLTIRSVVEESTDPSLLGLPSGACVISANKYIGFGRTGTQEEMQVGCSPEACPVLLFTPPLEDDQVLVLTGAEAMVSMKGHGRDAALENSLTLDYDRETSQASPWRTRTMLFMDALELDIHDSSGLVPDLLPGHIDRELSKAYAAFVSRDTQPYSEVFTGLWGCGAFGGDPEVKTLLQWCAASIAGVPLTFVCNAHKKSFLDHLGDFSRAVLREGWTVHRVLSVLRSLHPDEERAKRAFAHISVRLGKEGAPDVP